MERRMAVRFLLNAPVIIRWIDASGAEREDLGRIRDISTSGAFFTCHAVLFVGAKVRLEIHLPAARENAPPGVRLESTGKIIRTTETALGAGFAVRGAFALYEDLLHGMDSG
jgi:PilZ domain